jgi:undecaprenyl-diphosphatase
VLSGLIHIDRAATAWVVAHFSAPAVQWLLLPFTAIGYWAFVWLALAGAGFVLAPRIRAALWRATLAMVLALALVDYVCKPLVGRERPFVHGPKASAIVWIPTSTSFPSGHAASAAAGAMALSRVWPAATLSLWLLAAIIMLSRVALGVHYVSDVIAGALVGLYAAWLATVPPSRDGAASEHQQGAASGAP